MRINTFLTGLLVVLTISCNNQGREKKQTDQVQKAPLKMIPFNADSAYRFVAEQVAFGPRVVNTTAHKKCSDYLEAKLRSYTPHVIVQKGVAPAFDGTKLNFKNLIASFGPEGNNRILLAAHWDSRPFADYDPDPANHRKPIDGANDGASGVGVLMEIARQLSQNPPPVGVDIIFFDAEDYGPPQDEQAGDNTEDHWGIGSQYWSKQPHVPDYTAKYGILLDMVGAAGATFRMDGISMDYAPDVVRYVWEIGNRLGYSAYFLYEQGGYITDDHYYVNKYRKVPMIDVIHFDRSTQTGFNKYWHTMGDTMDKIDKQTLYVVGTTLLAVIYN